MANYTIQLSSAQEQVLAVHIAYLNEITPLLERPFTNASWLRYVSEKAVREAEAGIKERRGEELRKAELTTSDLATVEQVLAKYR
jgi:hypothetical protein